METKQAWKNSSVRIIYVLHVKKKKVKETGTVKDVLANFQIVMIDIIQVLCIVIHTFVEPWDVKNVMLANLTFVKITSANFAMQREKMEAMNTALITTAKHLAANNLQLKKADVVQSIVNESINFFKKNYIFI